jgi:hypothetical protein
MSQTLKQRRADEEAVRGQMIEEEQFYPRMQLVVAVCFFQP